MEESSGSLVGGFLPGTHGFPAVAGHGWPPEPLAEEVKGAGTRLQSGMLTGPTG